MTSQQSRPRTERLVVLYLQLAEAAADRQAADTRNRLLLLAGRSAHVSGWTDEAAFCRQLVLTTNPHHLIGNHATFGDALESAEYEAFDRQLQRNCSQEKAEHLATIQSIDTESLADEPPRLIANDILARLKSGFLGG